MPFLEADFSENLHLHAHLVLSENISLVPNHVATRLIDYHISCSHGISIFTLTHLDRHGFFNHVKNISPLIYDDGDAGDDDQILIKIIKNWNIAEINGRISVMACSRLLGPLSYNLLLDDADLELERRKLILENDNLNSIFRYNDHSESQSFTSGEYEYIEPNFNTI